MLLLLSYYNYYYIIIIIITHKNTQTHTHSKYNGTVLGTLRGSWCFSNIVVVAFMPIKRI